MSAKQAILIALAIMLGGTAFVAAIVFVYKTEPEMLGIAKPVAPAEADSTQVDTLSAEQIQLRELDSTAASLESLVSTLRDSLDKKSEKVEKWRTESARMADKYKTDLRERTVRRDSLAEANFAMYAKIYDQANPNEVAQILSNLDVRDAAAIIRKMKTKNAAKVLEAMDPVRAAGIMTIGQALVEG